MQSSDPAQITHLGPLERSVLEVIWENAPTSVSQVLPKLCQKEDRDLAYTTVMTIMTRLTEKGVLTRTKQQRGYLYQPATEKPQFLKQLVRNTISSLVDRYGQDALAAFVEESEQLSHQEKKSIQKQLPRR